MVSRSKKHSNKIVRLSLGVLAGSTLGLVALEGPVSAAPVTLENFESDTEGGYPNDWDVIQQRVELGETLLSGCTSPESSNYTNLDNLAESGSLWGPERPDATPTFGTIGTAVHVPYGYFTEWIAPGGSSQYLVGGSLPMWWYDGEYGFAPSTTANDWNNYPDSFFSLNSTQRLELLEMQAQHLNDQQEDPQWPRYEDNYDVTVLDGEGYGINWNSQVLQLYSWTDSYEGHVIHGPAVVSKDTLTVTGEAVVSFWFRASAEMDYYHVYGYLQDTSNCSNQIELFDATGESMPWSEITVDDIPAGTYRFVFVAGTYDGTWGQLGGSLLWIDDIACDGEASGAGDTCTLVDVCDGCGAVTGPGLELNEIELLPDDTPSRRPIQWVRDALDADAAAGNELPSTGSDPNLLSLAGALVVLGSGLMVLRRRQVDTARK